tara:strand:- start:776 stop:1360 length:585 start_codon:yes stop_codon:yes gene_type:complete
MKSHIKLLLVLLLVLIASVGIFMFKQTSGSEYFSNDEEYELEGIPDDNLAKIEKAHSCANDMVVESFEPVASDPMDSNGSPKELMEDNDDPIKGNMKPNECFPKDSLTPHELLPSSDATEWSKANPTGDGKLSDQNFLHAGFHVGINTVGQSLRNANLQLRSEPANPTQKVGPWMQSTIEPDLNRKPLEINASS